MSFSSLHLLRLATLLVWPLSLCASEAPIFLNPERATLLSLQTHPVTTTTFEETRWVLGQVAAIPHFRASLSSRIAGRLVDWPLAAGDAVEAGQVIGLVESRQVGSPPPKVPLVSPISGRIFQQAAQLGDPVEPDKTLLEIINLKELEVVATVPETLRSQLTPNSQATFHFPARPDLRLQASLHRIGMASQPQLGSVPVHFRIPNPDESLRPGMRAEVTLLLSQRSEVLAIPKAALQSDGPEHFVFVKDFELPNAYQKVFVKVGAQNAELVEVLSGLFEGDEVVTQGAYSLRFLGSDGPSLKEALDAAHGHEHAPDGSELDAQMQTKPHAHDDSAASHTVSPIWKYASFALAALLLLSLMFKKRSPLC